MIGLDVVGLKRLGENVSKLISLDVVGLKYMVRMSAS